MKKIWIFLLLLIDSSSFAAQYLCATNMQYVYTGDTQDSVIAACGKPDQIINQAPQNTSNSGEGNLIWYYQSLATNQVGVTNNGISTSAGALAAAPAPGVIVSPNQLTVTTGAMPTPNNVNLTVVFSNGQVSSIQQAMPGGNLGLDAQNTGQVVASYPCANGPIKTGDSMNVVATACGLPFMQKNTAPSANAAVPADANSTASSAALTLLVYKPQSYLPAQILIFQDGVLVGQK